MSVATKYALKYKNPNQALDEFKQAAMIGLDYARRNYDPSKGFTFSTYAMPCIEGYVLREIRRYSKYFDHASLDAHVSRNAEEDDGTSKIPCLSCSRG